MKKYSIFVLLFIFFLPFNVFALPREGVYYFFTYPNGLEVVSENYEDTVDEKEILLYSGTSDSNGEVVLEGWDNQGTIRIVEKVPNGYSIESKEITVDLSKQSSAEFVNTKGMINPKTGKSIILIIEVFVVGFGLLYLISIRKKNIVLLLPLIMISVLLTSVKAEQEDFTIIVKDKDGKRLSNVAVEVYSKAVTVDASPAVKVLANGGKFLDGEEEMYFRIPYDGCSFGDLMEYSSSNYIDSLFNFIFSYKNGYLTGGFVNSPEFFQNGDVLNLLWRPMESNDPIGDFDFNGEVLYFRGKKITELRSAIVFTVGMLINRIQNGDNYYIGDDTNSSCNIYDSNGLTPIEILLSPNQKYYLCWHNHPDGIYVNDTLFLGNVDSCFRQANLRYNSSVNQVELRSRDSMNQFYLWSPNNSEMYFSPIIYENSFLYRVMDDPNVIGSIPSSTFNHNSLFDIIGAIKENNMEMVDKIQIVENGETILTVNSSDFQTINDGPPSYIITNSSINSRVYEYIGRLAYNNCFN